MSKKAKKSPFKGKTGADAAKQSEGGSSYGYLNLPQGVMVFKPPVDESVLLDILPYQVTIDNHPDRDVDKEIAVEESLWYKLPFKVHRNVGVDNDTIACPTTFGKKCPICEYRKERKDAEASSEEIKLLYPKTRCLYVVIPIGHEKYKEKPHIWDISSYLFQDQLNKELKEDEDNEIFPDLEEGLSLKIRFEGKAIGSGKEFAETNRIDFKKRKKQYSEEILEEVPNLDEVLKVLPYKEIDKIFMEVGSGDEYHEEEDKPKKDKKKKKEEEEKPQEDMKRKKKKVKEEPAEETAPPKKDKKKKKGKK